MHEERTEALRDEAIELFKSGQLQAVVDKITAVGEVADDDYELQSLLGASLSKLGRSEEATDAFRAALRLRPNVAQAFYNLGAHLASIGRIDEARPLIQQTLLEDPHHAGANALILKIGLSNKDQPAKAAEWERGQQDQPAAMPQAQPPQYQPQAHQPVQHQPMPTQQAPMPQAARPAEMLPNQPPPRPIPPASAYQQPRPAYAEEKKGASPVIFIVIALLLFGGIGYAMYYGISQRLRAAETPEATVKAVWNAMALNQKDVLMERVYLAPDFKFDGPFRTFDRESMLTTMKMYQLMSQSKIKVGKAIENGTAAIVPATISDGARDLDMNYALIKKDDKWLLDLGRTVTTNPDIIIKMIPGERTPSTGMPGFGM